MLMSLFKETLFHLLLIYQLQLRRKNMALLSALHFNAKSRTCSRNLVKIYLSLNTSFSFARTAAESDACAQRTFNFCALRVMRFLTAIRLKQVIHSQVEQPAVGLANTRPLAHASRRQRYGIIKSWIDHTVSPRWTGGLCHAGKC
jgi:hypothetical protein